MIKMENDNKYYAHSLQEKPKRKKVQNAAAGNNKAICRHDYKNAIQVGNVDYVCPLCKELFDPLEWFFMNSFEFVGVDVSKEKEPKKLCTKTRNI